jgi:short subunit dehydrogenase-like uncharacterized protein
MTSNPCLIYGAYGYTGELIAREAARRGLRPILAGRRHEPLEVLSQELGLTYRAFNLEDEEALPRLLDDVIAVLHCAGPFVQTSRAMVESCLRSGTHYLDITGEIAVFESIYRRDTEARDAGAVLLPGTGLDVVPSDCLAVHLAQQLPDATHLELALASDRGTASRGTLNTMVAALPHLGAERVEGKIVPRPPVFDAREIEFTVARRWAMTIPWGDIATAYRSTGIPNIRVYMGTSPKRIARLRRIAPLLPILGSRTVKKALQWAIRRQPPGPAEEIRESARSCFWGSVRNAEGESRKALLEAPEGYKLTAMTAVECLQRVLDGKLEPGAWTPATAFGSDFIKSFEGVSASW